jgi:diguanylate cyclase (GGDEF)-like protein/PAS domain S-box-containing protein
MKFLVFLIASLLLLIFQTALSASDDVIQTPNNSPSVSPLQLTEIEKQWIKQNPVINITGDPKWLPYEGFLDNGQYIGIVPDHLKLIEKKTGLSFNAVPTSSWTQSLYLAVNKRVSIISGDAADVILNQYFRPSLIYSRNPVVIVMHHTHGYVDRLDEIKDKRIAIIKDYGYTADIYTQYPDIAFVEVEDIFHGLNDLANGKCDALLATMALVSYHLADMGLHHLRVVGKTPVVMELTLFVDKAQPVLYSIINKSLEAITLTSSHKILQKWINRPYVEKTDYRIVILLGGIFLLVVVVIVVWNRRLSREVSLRKQTENSLRTTKRDLNEAQHIAKIGSWTLDLVNKQLQWSDETYRIFEIEPDIFGSTYEAFINVIHPEDRERINQIYQDSVENKSPYQIVHRLLMSDGRVKWVEEHGETQYNSEGKPLRTVGTVQDITETHLVSTQLKESNDKFKALVENTQDFVWEVDSKAEYSYCSPQIYTILGYKPEELLGKTPFELMPVDEAERIKLIYERAKEKLEPFEQIENINLHKNGQQVVLETSGQPFFDSNGDFKGYRGIDRDITRRKESEEQLKFMATHDMLSGLYNRKMLEQLLSDEIHRAKRYQHKLSVFMLDIDNFKMINDTKGHQIGDKVIRSIGNLLLNTVRKTDVAARYGGEEFVIILPETTTAKAEELANRLCQTISDTNLLMHGSEVISITASIGVATYPKHAEDWQTLIDTADQAMYQAKNSGRNQVKVA